MNSILQPLPTLVSHVWPAGQFHSGLRYFLLALGGSLLIAASAKIQVPFYPVPMTMQTLVVLALGMAFGWRLAGATMLLYLA